VKPAADNQEQVRKSEQGKSNLGSRKPKTTAKITLCVQNESASKARQCPWLKKIEFDKGFN
jgi:hypothetical protein